MDETQHAATLRKLRECQEMIANITLLLTLAETKKKKK